MYIILTAKCDMTRRLYLSDNVSDNDVQRSDGRNYLILTAKCDKTLRQYLSDNISDTDVQTYLTLAIECN